MPINDNFEQNQIEKLLNSAWRNSEFEDLFLLRTKFEDRLKELGITAFQAEKNLGIEYKTLNRVLDGNLKKFDLIPLIKVGYFLGIQENEIVEIFTKYLSSQHKHELEQAKKSMFILNNFDLSSLKSLGVIDSVGDFEHIENRMKSILGMNSIFDYNSNDVTAALSSTNIKPKNEKNRKYFINKSEAIFKLIHNPNNYDRQALIEYFPKIRWHSTDFDKGFINVIKALFHLGVTVIFQPKIPLMQMRGATFEVNNKPCIVLTDYRNSYPTLWFAFLHELFHVLFDWEEIMVKRYHLSDEENDLFVLQHKENEANDFAREYLFPKHKVEIIAPRIKQLAYVREFASEQHVHQSIVYANYARIYNADENNTWAQLDKLIRPPMNNLIQKLRADLSHSSTAKEYADYYLTTIFNPK